MLSFYTVSGKMIKTVVIWQHFCMKQTKTLVHEGASSHFSWFWGKRG